MVISIGKVTAGSLGHGTPSLSHIETNVVAARRYEHENATVCLTCRLHLRGAAIRPCRKWKVNCRYQLSQVCAFRSPFRGR